MRRLDGITDNGHEFVHTQGDNEGQGSLVCCSSWGRKEWTRLSDYTTTTHISVFPGGSGVKNLPANAGDARDACLIPGLGRSPRARNGNPLHYSCLGNPTDRGPWQATVHSITKSDTTEHTCTHTD